MRKLGLLIVIVVASLAAAVVAGADGEENAGRQASGERGALVASSTVTFCDGGAQEAVLHNLQDAGAAKGEGAATVLPSSSLPATATVDSDTIVVTLTGEAFMTGAGPGDRIEVQARLDGVAMEPTPGPVGFHSGNDQDANSAMWCKRVPAGAHTVDIVWNVVDVGANNVVTGFLDDYVVRVERSD